MLTEHPADIAIQVRTIIVPFATAIEKSANEAINGMATIATPNPTIPFIIPSANQSRKICN